MKKIAFADFLRKKRLENDFGLREFARKIKMQPSNYCSVESGSLPPPADKIERMTTALGIPKGTKEYHKFIDLASKTRDEIPPDIEELIKSNSLIPAMLRTIEGQEVTPTQMRKIIEDIRSGRYKRKTSV